jgi:hypothetical protein
MPAEAETAASVSSTGASIDSFKLVVPRETDVWIKGFSWLLFRAKNLIAARSTQLAEFF